MNKIKIRYVMRDIGKKEIYFKWYSIGQIEDGLRNLFDTFFQEIIARDLFTGKKDKNGREIYKGDIIKIGNIGIAEIIYKDGIFSSYNEKNEECNGSLSGWLDPIEIIGNKHTKNK